MRGRGSTDETLDFPPRRAGLKALLRLAWPRDGYDVLSWRDPGASIGEILSIVLKLGRKARGG